MLANCSIGDVIRDYTNGLRGTVTATPSQLGWDGRALCDVPRGGNPYDIRHGVEFVLGRSTIVSGAGSTLFTTAAAGGNTGSGAINAGSVTNGDAWLADAYTIAFTSASAWQVKNSAGGVITSGAYANPTAIAFLGVSVTISGAPATGDTFAVTAVPGVR